MRRPSPVRRKKSEALAFRQALLHIRRTQEWTQDRLAAVLGVSKRTLSGWECAYWLPSFKQRLHVVLSLRNLPAEHVLDAADALGVSADPAVAPFLQPFRDELDPPPSVEPPAPPLPAPPPRAPVDTQALRAALDSVVRAAADEMDVRPGDLRALLRTALAAGSAHGATADEIALAVAPTKKKPAGADDGEETSAS